MVKANWQARAGIALVTVIAGAVMLAQACGGGSTGEDVTPTATSPPTSTAGSATPSPSQATDRGDRSAADIPDFTPGAGQPGLGLLIGGASEEFAAFLGIPFDQLESELSAEGATPASVAEAHDRTREELETFFTEQLQAELNEAVAAGTMSQEAADDMFERQASRIDDIIDGNVPFGGAPDIGDFAPGEGAPGPGLLIGGASEEFAAFLGIPFDQLQSELNAEGATPASVAEAHGCTREELKTFFTEQLQAELSEAVAAGTMSQEEADDMFERQASRIDDIIDGNVPFGGAPDIGDFAPGEGAPGPGLFIGGASEEFAAFLGIPFDQLESELSAEGATPASVAEAHGRTREELKTFFTEQLQAELSEAVAAGTMSQEEADDMFERQASRIDDIIDGEMPSGGFGAPPGGQ